MQEKAEEALRPGGHPAYEEAAAGGELALRTWMGASGLAAADLPADATDLPKSCPLWGMGLSLGQAQQAVRRARVLGPLPPDGPALMEV